MDPKTVERFWSKVAKSDGCWLWTRKKHVAGYGLFRVDRMTVRAHRVAWEITHGPIPAGMHVCHKCDNPPCCNPDHLFVGTPADNMRDKVSKGRSGMTGPRKLTEAQVIEARARHAAGVPYRKLAEDYGVYFDTMRNAVRGFTWKHLTASPSSENSGEK